MPDRPCTRPILQFYCATDDGSGEGCGARWLGRPELDLGDNAWCPNCGIYSPFEPAIEEELEVDACVNESPNQ